MKRLTLFLVILILIACSRDDSGEIKEEINKKKDKVIALNKEIKELEKELRQYADKDTLITTTPVIVEKINPKEFHHYFNANGIVEAVKEAYISPEINGQIETILVDEGDRVSKGQLLARLKTNVADNAIKELETALELASTVYEKQKQLWEKKIGSEIQFLEAKNNKESLESKLKTLQAQKEMAFIKSPISGIVDEIYMKKGEMLAPGQHFMQVIDLGELYINVDVSESYLPAINKNDDVILKFPTYPNEKKTVSIHRIGNVIEPDNRTFQVQLKIKNHEEKYKPNMIAIIQINDFSADSAIIIPSIIIKEDIKGQYVYTVAKDNDHLISRKRYIEPGRSYHNNTMVMEGLKTGDEVIISGYDQVSDGENISIEKIAE